MANITVGDLKDRIKDLPDDMDVVLVINGNVSEHDYIEGFRYARTMAILSNDSEPKPALCINTASDHKMTLDKQLELNGFEMTECKQLLF